MAKKAKRAGRPRLPGKGKGKSPFIGVRFGAGLLSRVDNYRKAQSDSPKQSEALRRLVELGLTGAGF